MPGRRGTFRVFCRKISFGYSLCHCHEYPSVVTVDIGEAEARMDKTMTSLNWRGLEYTSTTRLSMALTKRIVLILEIDKTLNEPSLPSFFFCC